MTETTTTTIHPFEAAGLGKAPFRLTGVESQAIATNGNRIIGEVGGVQVETKPGGTCDYCGTYIVNIFKIESSDGKRFHVGSDCVLKTAKHSPKLAAKVDAIVKARQATKRQEAKGRQLVANREAFELLVSPSLRFLLAGEPHPKGWAGKTLLDWIEWTRHNAGLAGQTDAAKVIAKFAGI